MNILPIIYIAIILLYCGGFGLSRCLKLGESSFFQNIWLGLCLLGISTYAINLVFPISELGAILAISPILISIILFYKEIKEDLHSFDYSYTIFIIIIPVIALWCAETIRFGTAYDTNLYHLQIVQWIREFPSVCGLGNLHSRLANSSTWYTIAALFPKTLASHTPTLMSAIFIISATGWVIFEFRATDVLWKKIFFITFSPLLIFYIVALSFANLYVDHIALFVCVMAAYEFLNIFLDKKTDYCTSLKLGMLYLALSFSLKPLAAPSLIFGLIVLAWTYRQKLISIRTVCAVLILPAILGILWCIRNSILSGYPIYPLPIFSLPVDWTMPISLVDDNRIAVMGWARWPHSGYELAFKAGLSYWFPSWLQMNLGSKSFIATILFPLLLSITISIYTLKKFYSNISLLLAIWMIVNISYWFYVAPDPRFGREYFWLFLSITCALLSHNIEFIIFSILKKIKYIHILILFSFFGLRSIYIGGKTLPVYAPTWPELETKQSINLSTNNTKNLFISTPVSGDQCGDAKIPCTPYPSPKLKLRDINNIASGFKIETD